MAGVDRTADLRSLEQREVALVRALMRNPSLLDARGEAGLRTAIALARLHHLPADGGEIDVEERVLSLRSEALKLLEVAGLRDRDASAPPAEKLRPVATILREQATRCLASLTQQLAGRVPAGVLDREVRERRLVLALGGGGGFGLHLPRGIQAAGRVRPAAFAHRGDEHGRGAGALSRDVPALRHRGHHWGGPVPGLGQALPAALHGEPLRAAGGHAPLFASRHRPLLPEGGRAGAHAQGPGHPARHPGEWNPSRRAAALARLLRAHDGGPAWCLHALQARP